MQPREPRGLERALQAVGDVALFVGDAGALDRRGEPFGGELQQPAS